MATLHHLPVGRTLHLLDVENLAGDPAPCRDRLEAVAAAYRATVRVRDDDHVLVGCDIRTFVDAGLAWPGARLVPGRGPDGADLALLDAADPGWVACHYGRVVIGSGDHAFAPLAWRLRSLGVAVVVVSRPEALARSLRRAAGLVRPLVIPSAVTPAA